MIEEIVQISKESVQRDKLIKSIDCVCEIIEKLGINDSNSEIILKGLLVDNEKGKILVNDKLRLISDLALQYYYDKKFSIDAPQIFDSEINFYILKI